jgi:hypothetical protein
MCQAVHARTVVGHRQRAVAAVEAADTEFFDGTDARAVLKLLRSLAQRA